MSDYKTSDIISYAIQQKPLEFENVFKSLMQDKLVDAVSAKKIEIAKTLFNPPEHNEDDEDFELEQDTEENQNA